QRRPIVLFSVPPHTQVNYPRAVTSGTGDEIDPLEECYGVTQSSGIEFVPRGVVDAHQIGLGCDSSRSIFATASRGDAQHMCCMTTEPWVGVGRVIAQRGVGIFLLQRTIDCLAIMDYTIPEGLRRIRASAAALIPQGQDSRTAVLISKILVTEIKT